MDTHEPAPTTSQRRRRIATTAQRLSLQRLDHLGGDGLAFGERRELHRHLVATPGVLGGGAY